MQFDNATSESWEAPNGLLIAASASNVVVSDSLYEGDSSMRHFIDELYRQSKITFDVLPSGYVAAVEDGEPVLVKTAGRVFESPVDATFSIGTETSNAIAVTVHLVDDEGDALAAVHACRTYLATSSAGTTRHGTAPDGGVAASGGATIIAGPAANLDFVTNFAADGSAVLTLTHAAGAATYYLVVVLPTGRLKVSNAITFA